MKERNDSILRYTYEQITRSTFHSFSNFAALSFFLYVLHRTKGAPAYIRPCCVLSRSFFCELVKRDTHKNNRKR